MKQCFTCFTTIGVVNRFIKKRFPCREFSSMSFDEMCAKKTCNHLKLAVIGCGAKGSPKAVSLVADKKLYLFNCGDGTNKLFMSSKSINSTRLNHIFLTHMSWDNIGGIYGKSLSAVDAKDVWKSPQVTIHGGKQMEEIMKHSVMFAEERLFSASLFYRDVSEGTFTDEYVMIDYVPLTHKNLQKVQDRRHQKKFVVKKCHLKRHEGKTFGFILMTLNAQKGFYVGKVEQESSAQLTGMSHGDRIVEINGQSVSHLNYNDVVELIRNCNDEIEVLAVDKDCDDYCVENNLDISSTMSETDLLAVEERDETFADLQAELIASEKIRDIKPVTAYIVKFHKELDKVNVKAMQELGIKGGPFMKKILEGEKVKVQGKWLTPEMLLEKQVPIRPVLVVECVSEDYLDSLLESEQISTLNSDPDTIPQIIVHFTPASLVEHPKYKEFMQRYEPDLTAHLMINENCPSTYQIELLKRHAVLNSLHPEIFPRLHCDKIVPESKGNVVLGVYGLSYFFKPKLKEGFNWDNVSMSSNEQLVKEHLDEDTLKDVIKQHVIHTREQCDNMEKNSDTIKEYPVINFLGTGSAVPSRYRAQTCILVETCKDEFIMLDCGENGLMHLYVMFGEKRAEEILCNLKGVFLSHLHYDHIAGIIALGLRRQELLAKQGRHDKLTLIAPAKMKKWLAILSAHVFNTERIFNFIPMACMQKDRELKFTDSTLRLIQLELNMKQFSAIPVDHVLGSFGVYLQHSDGWTMLYSGDTRPCPLLVEYGYDKTDYLIHEGTFSTSDTEMAFQKKHSTIGQAISIGKHMKARHTILTHFSQRYSKEPCFADMEDGIAFAYDFMQSDKGLRYALCSQIRPQPFFTTGARFTELLMKKVMLKPRHIPMVSYLKQALAMLFKEHGKRPVNSEYRDDLLYRHLEKKRKNSSDSPRDATNSKEQKLEEGIV